MNTTVTILYQLCWALYKFNVYVQLQQYIVKWQPNNI